MTTTSSLCNWRWLAVVFSLTVGEICAQAPAASATAPRAPEITPLTLPGAETHVFHATPQGEMRLHVFKPEGWRAADRRPAFVWFFGGGWTHGLPSPGWAQTAAKWGLVGVAPDYRTHDRHGTSPLASVADARAAMNSS